MFFLFTCVDADEGPRVDVVTAADPPASPLRSEDLQPDPQAPLDGSVLTGAPNAAAPGATLIHPETH